MAAYAVALVLGGQAPDLITGHQPRGASEPSTTNMESPRTRRAVQVATTQYLAMGYVQAATVRRALES